MSNPPIMFRGPPPVAPRPRPDETAAPPDGPGPLAETLLTLWQDQGWLLELHAAEMAAALYLVWMLRRLIRSTPPPEADAAGAEQAPAAPRAVDIAAGAARATPRKIHAVAGRPCRWREERFRPRGAAFTRWLCITCAGEGFTNTGGPPVTCKRGLQPRPI